MIHLYSLLLGLAILAITFVTICGLIRFMKLEWVQIIVGTIVVLAAAYAFGMSIISYF